MEHEQLEETVAAYALGALDVAGRADVERTLLEHLTGCGSCRELFHDLREVTSDLALAAKPREVPAEVEERILQGIRERKPQAERTAAGRSRLGRAAVAAAIVALGAWNLQLASRVNNAAHRTDTITAVLSLMSAPDARSTTLMGRGGTLVFVRRPGEAVLVGHDVASPPGGRVLQLWLMRAGVPTSAGVFRPSGGVVALPVPLDTSGVDGVAVTEERGPNGADRPTSAPTYSATLSA